MSSSTSCGEHGGAYTLVINLAMNNPVPHLHTNFPYDQGFLVLIFDYRGVYIQFNSPFG